MNDGMVTTEGNDGPKMRMIVDDRVPTTTSQQQYEKFRVVMLYVAAADNGTADKMAE